MMSVSTFPAAEPLAQAVAELMASELEQKTAPTFFLALSGGRIAVPLFQTLASRLAPSAVHGAHFFWADERMVPPHNPESNYRTAEELLFSPLNIPAAQVHRIHGELPPEVAAQEAEGELKSAAGAAQRQPIFDLILLGMGEDGHVASLFPSRSRLPDLEDGIYRFVVGPKPPPKRVTLTYNAITFARQVWVLVSGSGKSAALRKAMQLDRSVPLGRVFAQRSSTRLFVERQALDL